MLRVILVPLLCGLCVLPAWAGEDPSYLHGKFVRADLVTDDLAASQAFYGKLFGWTFERGSDYAVAHAGQRALGALVEQPRPGDGKARPRWIAFISVASVESARQQVVEAGGQVLLEPRDLHGAGMAGVFSDPQGAVFGVVHHRQGDPEDVIADMGSWIWIQLLSHDARKAAAFYARLADYETWDYEPQSKRLQDRTNILLASGGYARAVVTELAPERRPAWLPFVRVADVAGAVQLAQQLGGQVIVAPSPDLFDGKAAVLADPRGAAIGILEWSEEETGAAGEGS